MPNNIWKIAFSPCNHYLAIPKQDFDGQDCILIIFCPNWHALSKADDLYVYEELICSAPVWSLTFGQRNYTADFLAQHQSPSFVNCLHDLTEGLFLAAGLADGRINVWNVETGELSLVLLDHKSTVCGLTFSSNSMQLASCSHDKTIKFWNLLDDGEEENIPSKDLIEVFSSSRKYVQNIESIDLLYQYSEMVTG